jgi:LmbE family N-acetylglucosaminyl deacetylase
MKALKKYLQHFQPDVLLTFGPDGEYGHSEHIVTGAMVTELLLREAWVEKYPIYFPVDVEEDVMEDDELGYVDKQYLNLKITYTDEDEQKMINAAKCYDTQFTAQEIQELIEEVTKDKSNRKYFRKFNVTKEMKTEFWD